MSTERRGTEFFVGLFLILGFSVIAIMVVKFGGMGRGLTKYYQITVEFPNASGLVRNADVLLVGARIGHVEGTPYLLVKDGFSVGVKLNIREDVKLPRDAIFVVNQSGLLGDCFIDVLPPGRIDAENLIQPGESVVGRNKPGLDALQQEGSAVLEKLQEELDEIKRVTVSINENLLSKQNLDNLSATFENLKTTSANLSQSSKQLDGIFDKVDGGVDSAKKTLETIDHAAGDLRTAMGDFKRVAESTNRTLDSAKTLVDTGNRIVKKAERGEGAVGVLLSDEETAANLKAFATNLRRYGPVFYKDRAEEDGATSSRRPPSRAIVPHKR
jgi:phospholipid/cholesterol/gamma-HCH transport system substrate-binding protein